MWWSLTSHTVIIWKQDLSYNVRWSNPLGLNLNSVLDSWGSPSVFTSSDSDWRAMNLLVYTSKALQISTIISTTVGLYELYNSTLYTNKLLKTHKSLILALNESEHNNNVVPFRCESELYYSCCLLKAYKKYLQAW